MHAIQQPGRPRLHVGATILLALLAAGPSLGSGPAEDCAERWVLKGVRPGSALDDADDALAALGARARDPEKRDGPRRTVWVFRGEADRGERMVLDADAEGAAVAAVTLLVEGPERDFAEVLAEYTERWGAPAVDRFSVGGDRADLLTEASVWIDRDCNVKATLLGIKELTARGVELRKLGVRLERAVDPIGHLGPLRDEVWRLAGR